MADEKLYLDFAGLSKYDELVKNHIKTADDAVLEAAKKYTDEAPFDAAGSAATAKQELENGIIAEHTAAINKLNGTAETEGSVAKAISDAKSELNESIDAVEAKADKNAGDITALTARVGANETNIGSVDSLETAQKDLVGAVNELKAAIGAGGTAAAITLTTTTTTEGALKSYTLKQGETTVGVIDIPKDMVVESGEVVVDPEGQPAGTYIKMVLANVAEPLFINVGTLVDLYVAKANAAQVQVAIDPATREISATIVAGSVGTAELADNAVVTAKIADANVTKAKLSTEVQASLDKADAAVPQATYDEKVAELVKADEDNLKAAKEYADSKVADIDLSQIDANKTAIEALQTEVNTNIPQDIATAKQEAIDAAATDATTKAGQALADAKAYADAEDAKIESRVDALETDNTQNKSDIAALQESVGAFARITEAQVESLFTQA